MKNDIAYDLLKKNPYQLICTSEFQQSILKIARKFKQRGSFAQESEEDITQEITIQIMERKITYMQKKYQPDFGDLKQYFERIAYNIAVELVNVANHRQKLHQPMDAVCTSTMTTQEGTQELIQNELQQVNKFLASFPRQKPKLLLLMKLYSRTIIESKDILNFKPSATPKEIQHLLVIFGKNYAAHEDGYLYSQICQFMNDAEGKTNSSDTLRKWLSIRINDLRKWMNQHSSFKYDKEAVRNLIQVFFTKNLLLF